MKESQRIARNRKPVLRSPNRVTIAHFCCLFGLFACSGSNEVGSGIGARSVHPGITATEGATGQAKPEDYLYVLDEGTGEVLRKVKVASGPDYIIAKGGKLHVRTYNTDYVFTLP